VLALVVDSILWLVVRDMLFEYMVAVGVVVVLDMVLGLENGKPLVLPVTDRVDMVALGLVVELVPVEVVVVLVLVQNLAVRVYHKLAYMVVCSNPKPNHSHIYVAMSPV
jgi:hypothetical protein